MQQYLVWKSFHFRQKASSVTAPIFGLQPRATQAGDLLFYDLLFVLGSVCDVIQGMILVHQGLLRENLKNYENRISLRL